MRYLAAYGSLKRERYNHNPEKMRFVGTGKIDGTMFAVSSYPAVVVTGDYSDNQVDKEVRQFNGLHPLVTHFLGDRGV